MAPGRDKDSSINSDEAENSESEEVQLLDDDDIINVADDVDEIADYEDEFAAEDEIVYADSDIVESLDDESTGEVQVETEDLLADEDPLSAFAKGPARQQEVEQYMGLHADVDSGGESGEVSLEADETTSRVEFPEYTSRDVEEAKTQSSAKQVIFDPEGLSDDADWHDELEETPGIIKFSGTGSDSNEHEHVPNWLDDSDQTPEVRTDFVDEVSETTDLHDSGGSADWDSDQDSDEQKSESLYSDLNWSSLEDIAQPSIPDIGETRVDGVAPEKGKLDEKTLIFNDDGPVVEDTGRTDEPFLLVLKGEDEGREIELSRQALTLGRGPDNDLVFPDIACSRRHSMIEFVGENWVLSDLSSGNGTFLNGEKVSKEVLYDGDEIEIGNTVLQFLCPGLTAPSDHEQAPMPESSASGPVMETVANAHVLTAPGSYGLFSRLTADPRQKKILMIVAASFCGLILFLLLIRLIVPAGQAEPSEDQLIRQKALEKQRQFEKHLESAKNKVQKKEWKRALLEIQQAKKVYPKNQLAKDYQEKIREEMSAESALDQAQIAMGSKHWDLAMTALMRIDKESEYAEEAEHLKAEIDENIINDLLDSGLEFMRAGKYNQALVKFDEVKRKDPDNSQIDELRHDCHKQIDIEQRSQSRKRAAIKRKDRRHRARRRKLRARSGMTGQILALYKNMEVGRAILKAEDRGDLKQIKLLKKFRVSYNRGIILAKKTGMAKDAIEVLSKALSLDHRISAGRGKYHESIVRTLAKVCFIRGMDYFNRRKYPGAFKYFKKALKYNPNEVHAKKKLRDLKLKAKSLYENAYVIKSTQLEKAIGMLKTVMAIVEPRNVNYVKAKKLLKRLQPAGGFYESDSGF